VSRWRGKEKRRGEKGEHREEEEGDGGSKREKGRTGS